MTVGKGIYDVDAFRRQCSDFPENLILSHDLLESCYSRSALLSDVILYEDYPSSYAVEAGRQHRWIRGDWQIAEWLFPRVRGFAAINLANPISALSRWKILDNLRRSLLPSLMIVFLLLSWFSGSIISAATATVFVLTVIFLPRLLNAIVSFTAWPTDLPFSTHLATTTIAMGRPLAECLLTLTLLPFEAYNNLDAAIRSLVRMYWTGEKLLEWKTSGDSSRSSRDDLATFFRSMLLSPSLAVLTITMLAIWRPEVLRMVWPLLLLWIFSPLTAWWLSRQFPPRTIRLSERQHQYLRKLSRRTWRYFETFVTEDHNWLPPDNVHLTSGEVVASRTSPTNIGMALLADLAACDFGYCSVERLLDRTQNTFSTLHRMEQYRGHFYNWYDTQTLMPLVPRYVSSVDSGNLAGNLLVLGSGLLQLADAPIVPEQLRHGLRDTLSILLDEARGRVRGAEDESLPRIDGQAIRLIAMSVEALDRQFGSVTSVISTLTELMKAIRSQQFKAVGQNEVKWWVNAFDGMCEDHIADLHQLAAWTTLTPPPARLRVCPAEIARRADHPAGGESGQIIAPLRKLMAQLDSVMSLRDVTALPESSGSLLENIEEELSCKECGSAADLAAAGEWLQDLRSAIAESSHFAADRIRRLEQLAAECENFADMDFEFLHNRPRQLLSIGYNAVENRLDSSCYDLLASEARLCSYVVVAQGKMGQDHWFALGRLLTSACGAPALLSWSGSMFEYLMPLLVMPTYDNTLLDQTCRAIVKRQIQYGRQRGVPWGISESGYNTTDLHANYQYRAFGVPGLGLKRGLVDDLVIAPYASALALMVLPDAACRNLERLSSEGREGRYGLFEAVDYTPSRLPPGSGSVTVKQVMAHHAGMSLLAMAYILLDRPMQRRFQANPALRASELLLHERIPRTTVPVYPHATEAGVTRSVSAEEAGTMRVFTDPGSSVPEVHLLSNGQYHVMVTSAGGGYSRWKDLAVTRWREDPTRDCWGTFCYLRDVESGVLWSNAWHPTASVPKFYEAIFTQSRAEFRRRDEHIDSHTQISVAAEDDLELRQIILTNRSERPRTIELTSYAEVVLAPQTHDEAHQAFSNLFVQTEIIPARQAIFCTRRPRSAEERPPWMIHMMTAMGTAASPPSFETDRMKFTGRGRTTALPAAFDYRTPLSNTAGSTLDPIVSIRHTLLIQPNETVRIDIVTGVAESRSGVEAMAEKYSDPSLADRVFELAWTRGPILLQQLNASIVDAQAYGRLAGSVIYASSLRRARPSVLIRNRRGQSGLWGYGISGDLPIVLVRIRNIENIELVRQAVQAHAYWRMKGLSVDLVIWNEDDSGYRQTLQDTILDLVAASPESAMVDRPAGIFIRRGEQMSEDDRSLLQTVARVILPDDGGTLIDQVNRRDRLEVSIPLLRPVKRRFETTVGSERHAYDLAFFNGLGGFSQDGREYIIVLKSGMATPAPWVNVIANSQLGTVVSESGSAYTWAENSHEFRLTPWNNDPVSDTCGEAFYLRDEMSGRFWSPSPAPARGTGTYITRHGFGYSVFEHTEDGITTELCVYVAVDAPVKFARVRITNRSGRSRPLSLTGYWEWVLGEVRGRSLMHVITEVDNVTGAIFVRNHYSPEFSDRVVFADCSEMSRTITGDRTEFLGRNGAAGNPAALRRTRLSNRTGAGFDPCAAIQTQFTLDDRQEKVIIFTVGAGRNDDESRQLVQRFRGEGNAQGTLEGVWHYWSQALGAVYVETPDAAVNFMANGWLVYQTLVCRMWARTGFYQSGGAFGFRDQLQDAMALIHAEPGLLREHLLRAASRQFREGDVQHWWHPPAGRGVRTHFSDDLLWLPLAICRYVRITGDTGLLNEIVPFLSARLLHADEESNYDLPHISDDSGSLYEHGIRAIDRALRFGVHGLPLMGCGDWNDGMNLVGQHGKGESVWLAFFLYDILNQFAKLALSQGDAATADRYLVEAGRLRGNIEQHGWDGEWYRRAWFDDGTPLGTQDNSECQIDSISQSWAILSGAGTAERTQTAMESVNRRLVRRDARLIQLLDPPFDKSNLNPGYIRGYVPGVRENGGQYTHAAIWTVMAFAAIGDRDRAWELFSMINPVTHGSTPESLSTYRVEPYVVAADVYAVPPHTGRGGWTWYTGSAGWMYRLITESLLGLQLDVDKLRFNPRPPRHWPSFKIHYRHYQTFYHIHILNQGDGTGIRRFTVDGHDQRDHLIVLINDHVEHFVEIELQ